MHFHTHAQLRGQSLLTSNVHSPFWPASCRAQRPAAHCLFSASLAALRVLNWLKIMLRVQSVASSE